MVHPSVPAKSVKELIELAKAKPNTINFGSAGIGATSHLSGELFKSAAGIQIVHVPYKGTGAALQDLLAGNIQMAIDSIPVYLPHLKSGAVRALAVSTPMRSPVLPDLPPIADTLPGFDASAMNYVTARAGTPRPIVERLNREINAVLAAARRSASGCSGWARRRWAARPRSSSCVIRSESAKWKKVIEISGAKAE